MPNTTAVKKAKDTMAASTFSLVCNSIIASFTGLGRLADAGCPAPKPESMYQDGR
jgi:hypothetical protein